MRTDSLSTSALYQSIDSKLLTVGRPTKQLVVATRLRRDILPRLTSCGHGRTTFKKHHATVILENWTDHMKSTHQPPIGQRFFVTLH